MANCTMPHALGFHAWFEAKFGDLCAAHDAAYASGADRYQADLDFCAGVMRRGYVTLSVLSYIFVRGVGRFHYRRAV